MAGDIFEAIQKLEDKLIRINKGIPLTYNTDILDQELSNKLFVNPKLLPESLRPDYEGVATQEERQRYSALVLQAGFNIAYSSKGGYIAAIKGLSGIQASFGFLDGTWVPKIVDEHTYQVGKALQEFLEEALSEEVLAKVPETVLLVKIREPVSGQLAWMKGILDKRLEIYEAHSNPENVVRYPEYVEIVEEQRLKWQAQREKYLNTKAKKLNFTARLLLNKDVPNDSIQLEEYLRELDQVLTNLNIKLQELETVKDEYDVFTKKWKEENESYNLPDSMKVSRYTGNLINTSQKTVQAWATIFNNQDLAEDIFNEKIGKTLKDFAEISDEDIEAANDTIKLLRELVNKQNGMFPKQIADFTFLKQYIDNLKKVETRVDPIEKPAALKGEPPELSLSIELSKKENLSEKFLDDIASYTNEIERLDAYKVKLMQQKQHLETLFAKACPVPVEANGTRLKERFIQAFDAEQQKLQPQILLLESQIKAVESLTQKTNLEVIRLKREHQNLNRGAATKTATQRIRDTYAERDRAKQELSKAKVSQSSFMIQYIKERASISSTFGKKIALVEKGILGSREQIESNTSKMESLTDKKREREIFLKEASKKITQFIDDLKGKSGLYIPVAKIPKAEFMKYMECPSSGGIFDFVNDLYNKERNGNAWYGWNLTRFQDRLSHNLSLFGPSEFDWDTSDLFEYMENKLKLIDQELAGKEKLPTSSWLPKENLWTLEHDYQDATLKKSEGERSLQEGLKDKARLTLEKENLLEDWEARRTVHDQRVDKNELENQLAILCNDQAAFALDFLKLGYDLTDIEETESTFDKEFIKYAQLENGAIVEQTSVLEEQLRKISDSLSKGVGWNKSVNERVHLADSYIQSYEREWQIVKKRAKETVPVTDIPPELPQEIQDLKKRFKDSIEDKGLEAVHESMKAKVADKQRALTQLKELAKIQIKGNELVAKASSLATLSVDDRGQLYEAIKLFQNLIKGRITDIEKNRNDFVMKKFAETTPILEKLTQVNKTIEDLEKLAEIEYVFSNFIKRIDAHKGDMVLTRNLLLREIADFSKSELCKSLPQISENTDPAVKEKIGPILAMKTQIELHYSIYKPNELFAENEVERDRKDILNQLDKVIEEYNVLVERYRKLPDWAPKEKQKLFNDIKKFEASELVTTLKELDTSLGQLHAIQKKLPKNENDSDFYSAVQDKLALINKSKRELFNFKNEDQSKTINKEKETITSGQTSLQTKYFGEKSIFTEYLQERAKTYWFRDLCSSFAAFIFGCIGYKTGAQERAEYLEELQSSLQQYQATPAEGDDEDLEKHQDLCDKIEEGLEKFSPRKKTGEEGYDHSLNAKLLQLQGEVEAIHKKFTPKSDDSRSSLVAL